MPVPDEVAAQALDEFLRDGVGTLVALMENLGYGRIEPVDDLREWIRRYDEWRLSAGGPSRRSGDGRPDLRVVS